MSEYVEQAKQFLKDCNATMKIEYVGLEKPTWDKYENHATYDCTITTPKGSMTVHFYASVANTWKRKKPTEYDILACLQKYDVGDIDNFMLEFGYEIKCSQDWIDMTNAYDAVVIEYQNVCRCFTEEQIEKMQEIQ